jgi:hypothetical protein
MLSEAGAIGLSNYELAPMVPEARTVGLSNWDYWMQKLGHLVLATVCKVGGICVFRSARVFKVRFYLSTQRLSGHL